MSVVGGARLAQPGTQVNLASGVPVLPKGLSARSWIVSDAESGEVLAAHNAHWRLAPASTLKMLFADTLLPRWPKTTEHKVEPSDLAGIGSGSSMVGVKEDETYTVEDLWRGVFLMSGNDAVHVLSAMNGGIEATVDDMNAHAQELQALDTVVVSPDGYDAPKQVSSAYDLTLIARSGLQKKDFREYCSTVRAKFPGETKKNKKGKKVRESYEIQNTNRLLRGDTDVPVYQGIAGVKNGNTTNAGATFTGVAERDGKVLLVTVMNPQKNESNEVYKETAKLFDWGFAAAGKVEPVGELVAPRSARKADARPGPSASPDRRAVPPAGRSRWRAPPRAAAPTAWASRWASRAERSRCSRAACSWSTGAGRCRTWCAAVRVREGGNLGLLARRRRPGGAEQHQFRGEVDPQQQGHGDAEGAVHALRGHALHIAAEQQFQQLEADRAGERGDDQTAPGGFDAGQQGEDVQQEQEVGADGDGERRDVQDDAAPAALLQPDGVADPADQRGGDGGGDQGDHDRSAETDEDAEILALAQDGVLLLVGQLHTARRHSRMEPAQLTPVNSSTAPAMRPMVPALSTSSPTFS
ncbi:hypothetical protein SHKM778_10940 [Streptomyces sp. KM77-8]|uniref:Peptidase S11 D-alanyl-D-alanine carboxypeptidase A N-terminal domain-containing protein n=1 Tax=Streptomyces haneummycinicus TaxID=3074435 RepID=A0AAT9HBE1_9ACTN